MLVISISEKNQDDVKVSIFRRQKVFIKNIVKKSIDFI
ncbi:MAG: hypothetical protein RL757_2982 [Bacteroidota bacterium]|jgi:hypothetical protein